MNALLAYLAGPDRISWRRPFFGLLFFCTATWLLVMGHLTAEQWLTFTIPLAAFVVAGEAVPAAMRSQRPAPARPSPPAPEADTSTEP